MCTDGSIIAFIQQAAEISCGVQEIEVASADVETIQPLSLFRELQLEQAETKLPRNLFENRRARNQLAIERIAEEI
jgi:hypothetical protein